MSIFGPVIRYQTEGNSLGSSRAIVLSDFEWRFGANFLDVIENLFADWGSAPREVTCSFGSARSQGKYGRVRKRIRDFLEASKHSAADNLALEIGDQSPRDPQSFHRGSVVVSLGLTNWTRDVWFAVDESLLQDRDDEFIGKLASSLFQLSGPSYGYILSYPKQFGVGYYVASVISVPSGRKLSEFDQYGERITRWRDRKRLSGLREHDGYIREVYPVNFLLDAHLNAPVHGTSFRTIAEEFGSLSRLSDCPGVYLWIVSPSRLEHAQDLFETSGLVLSAPIEPIPLGRPAKIG